MILLKISYVGENSKDDGHGIEWNFLYAKG